MMFKPDSPTVNDPLMTQRHIQQAADKRDLRSSGALFP